MRRTASRASAVAAASALTASLLVALPAVASASPAAHPPAATPAGQGRFVLVAHSRGKRYAPTFTGNGYLGVRVPPAGQGYAGGSVPAQSELAGFYARPSSGPKSGRVQQRASIPTWSTLRIGDGTDTFSLKQGSTTRWRQQLDLHTGVITTSMRWRAPDGHVADLTFEVFVDRARHGVGVVRALVRPHWTGRVVVTDLIDGRPATLSKGVTRGWQPRTRGTWESVRAVGTGVTATLASRLRVPGAPTARPIRPKDTQSIGQRVTFPVRAGHRYTVTKFVGIASSDVDRQSPRTTARRRARVAEDLGVRRLRRQNDHAWARLWAGRIGIVGKPRLATEVNASQFYLWSSTTAGLPWSVSPAGLSSNGYDGHIFWDAETWMHPSLLAQHPDLARAMDRYRELRLAAARRHAKQTGYHGARFPWESALDGTEQIPPPVSVNSEGLYEMHISADIALAQWQYYEATGRKGWLRTHGWPVLRGAAAFWASKAVRSGGAWHIRHVTGPDEENPDVTDEAFTNVGAATTLRIATRAASVVGASAPKRWASIAAGLVVPVKKGIHPEFRGYGGQLVKQADVTMLQYPWAQPMPAKVAQADLNYYVPRSDPGGPSMSDAINMIDTAALGTPGCASYVYTQRSIEPFMRDVFDQFSETRTGGAFTFMTGIGGFLQEFLYGYSGMRLHTGSVVLDPSLTAQLPGVVLHDIAWHGRRFTVAIGQHRTRVTLTHGHPLPVTVRGTRHVVASGTPLTVATRRPDLTATGDFARCRTAHATSSERGTPPLAAVDGSPATGWQPGPTPARLTVPLRGHHTLSTVRLLWGRHWPPAPAPNVPPPPTPVHTLRPASYSVLVSANGSSWHRVALVRSTTGRRRDTVTFPATRARYVQVRVLTTRKDAPHPMLEELTVPAH